MSGSITVKGGTFAVADGTTFRNVRSVSLAQDARCAWTTWPFATDSFALTAAAGAVFWSDAANVTFPATAFAFDGTLTLPANATVTMSSATTVTVSENFAFDGLCVRLTDSSTMTAGTKNLFVVNAELDESVRTLWAGTQLDASCPRAPGRAYSFVATAAGGKTVFALVVADLTAATEVATYDGTQDGLWGASLRTTFAGAGPKAVSVSGDVTAGAIDFTADGYSLAGSGSVTFADAVQPQVKADAVTATVADGLDFQVPQGRWLQVDVEKGGLVTFSQALSGGGLWKTGGGRLALENDANDLSLPTYIAAGMLTADPAAALGADAVVLTGGTLALGDTDTTASPTDLSLTVRTGAADAMAILKAEADARVTNFVSQSGALLKRGGGTLTIAARVDETVTLASGNGRGGSPYWSDKWSFDADGLPTPDKKDAMYAGLNVFEGALSLAGEGSSSVFQLLGGIHAGSGMTTDYKRQVSLSASDCTVDLSGQTLWLGSGIQGSNTKPTGCTLTLNDATLRAETFYEGYQAGRASNTQYLCLTALTNASLEIAGTFYANNHNSGENAPNYKTEMTATNSALRTRYFALGGLGSNGLYGYTSDKRTFDASLFGGKAGGTQGQTVTFKFASDADWTFRNGSVWHVASIKANSGMRAVFTFDDAEWKVDPDVFDFRFGGPDGNVKIRVVGMGLKLAADEGQVRNLLTPVEGDGGFVKTGAGTVNFKPGEYLVWDGAASTVPTPSAISDPNKFTKCVTNACADAKTARYTGLTQVLGGTLAFAAGTIAADAVPAAEVAAGAVLDFGGAVRSGMTVAGAGTVRQAAFAGGTTLKMTLADDWTGATAVLFDGCTFDGQVTVDFGRDAVQSLAATLPSEPISSSRSTRAPIRTSRPGRRREPDAAASRASSPRPTDKSRPRSR